MELKFNNLWYYNPWFTSVYKDASILDKHAKCL
jgi:hypothetical protein